MSVLTVLTTAAVAGALSLPHCALMCGPLALASCSRDGHIAKAAAPYLLGRLVSYSALGALLGAVGYRWVRHASLDSFQMLALAGLLLWCGYRAAQALARHFFTRERVVETMAPASLVTLRRSVDGAAVADSGAATALAAGPANNPGRGDGGLVGAIKQLLAQFRPRSGLAMGLLTGVLPCGALVGAWLLAAASAHPLLGSLSMLAFAVTSSPALIGAMLGRKLWRRLGSRLSPLIAAAGWLALAALLVGRWLANSGGASCH